MHNVNSFDEQKKETLDNVDKVVKVIRIINGDWR